MAKKPAIHTVPDGQGGWINRTEGSERGFGRAERKVDAEAIGRESAERRGTEHISHRRDDTIGERRSYATTRTHPGGSAGRVERVPRDLAAGSRYCPKLAPPGARVAYGGGRIGRTDSALTFDQICA
jgi:hypothetical protein